MERQRALAAALAPRQMETSAAFLESCRRDLRASLGPHEIAAARPQSVQSPWGLFWKALSQTVTGFDRLRVPLGAVALVALGFVVARLTAPWPKRAPESAISLSSIVPIVRSIQPDGSGGVQISLDETRHRVVSGRMDDQDIQQLLLAAAHGENPAARLESLGVLKDHAESSPVRDALLNAVSHDPNPGVRLAALEGLKPLAAEPEVRKVLSQVLLADENSAIRMQVVDLLTAHGDDDIVGVLQDLMERENNSYVRSKSEQALKAMNASLGTF
jgi:hypothetical protein